jgi:hypothetical protein
MAQNTNNMYGAHHIPGYRWTPRLEVSQNNVGQVPPEELIVDPYLPGLGTDPYNPAHIIAIPRGRFCAIGYASGQGTSTYRFQRTDTGKTPLTLHEGKNLTPVGMSINDMYKEAGDFMTDDNNVKFRRGFVAEVPFVASVNDGQGTLAAGDYVTGYWGSLTSTTAIANIHRGKPVKWVANQLYTVEGSASGSQSLTSATSVGIQPLVVAAFNGTGNVLTGLTPTYVYNTTLSNWTVTFAGVSSGLVATVLYEYGQDEDQIAGEVLRIQSVSDVLSRDDYLKWVTYAQQDRLNYPPAATRFPVTSVGSGTDPDVDWETPSTVTAGKSYKVANFANGISVHSPVLVAIKGTITANDGTTTTYADWNTLPTTTNVKDARGYFVGLYHNVNWKTGIIELSDAITSVTAIKVLYSYITDPRDGAALWGEGILGLTAGDNVNNGGSPAYGLPSNLNFSDVVAAMRLIVAD